MERLAPALISPLSELTQNLRDILPGLLWFLIIAIVGYLISSLFGWLLKKVLYQVNIDKRLRKMDLHDSIGGISIAKLSGIILKWYLFILFLDQATAYLGHSAVSLFIGNIVSWLPKLILSIVIIIIGLILIDFIINKLLEVRSQYIKAVAHVVKGILIVVVMFTAIEQLGIKTQLAQNIFLMVIGAVLVTFSIALGIGLGLSIKDEIKPLIKKYRKKLG